MHTITIAIEAATVREDNGKPLGVVGSRYAVVQNADAFGFLDGAFRAGELTPERADPPSLGCMDLRILGPQATM